MKHQRRVPTHQPAAVAELKQNDDLPQMLRIQDVMRITGLCYQTIYQRIRSGSIPAQKLGGHGVWLIPKDKLLESLFPESATV